MGLIEKIPEMTDEDVTNLLANARRLSEEGTDKQKSAAAELLPALEEAAAERLAARQAAMAARRAALKKTKVEKAEKAEAAEAAEAA